MCTYIFYYFGTLLGANPIQSRQNLHNWLDSVILCFCNQEVFIYNCAKVQKLGWYQGIQGKPYNKITSYLSVSCGVGGRLL